MSVLSIQLFTATVLGLAVAVPVTAQSGGAGGDWNDENVYGRRYDRSTVETIRGEVIEIGEFMGRRVTGRGVHLLVEADDETIAIHLGPAHYVDFQEPKIEVGDRVTVRGSRIEYGGAPAIIAATVETEAGTLKLRDEMGIPYWNQGCECGAKEGARPPGRS